MTTTTIALIIAALVVGGAVFIWFILRGEKTEQSGRDINTQ